MKHVLALVVSLLVVPALASAQAPAAARTLTVVSASPSGEVASLAEANEIRIVFSEPMVTLGQIPAVVRAPFVRDHAGDCRARSAGPARRSLIFTPDAKQPLPYATRYDVTVEATATAVSGRTLGAAHSFSFTTPTVKLLSTDGYRRGGRGRRAVRRHDALQPAGRPGGGAGADERAVRAVRPGRRRRSRPTRSSGLRPLTRRRWRDSTPRSRRRAPPRRRRRR